MKDKKTMPEKPSDVLRGTTIDPQESRALFPTLEPDTFEVLYVVDPYDTLRAILAMELPVGPSCALHVFIPHELKTKENIQYLTRVFFKDVKPWIKAQGKKYVIFTCPHNDLKTMKLAKTFGFDPKDLWMGIQEV